MRLPDPRRSYAVLIGTSIYRSRELADLPAVHNNLTALADLLTDPALGGLRTNRCAVVADPGDTRSVYRALRQHALVADDTLLVYFAGHGRTGPRNELYLGLHDTDPAELAVSALPFELVREVFAESPAANRVLILDCCFSGRAIADMGGPAAALLGQVGIDGTYTLTATPANAVALAPVGDHFTAFTGQLIALLRSGVPDGPEFLNFGTIYPRLRRTMAMRGLPIPQQRGTGTVDQLALTRNPAHRTTHPSRARHSAQPGPPPRQAGYAQPPPVSSLPQSPAASSAVAMPITTPSRPDPAPPKAPPHRTRHRQGSRRQTAILSAAAVVLIAVGSVIWWVGSRGDHTPGALRRGQIVVDTLAVAAKAEGGKRSYPLGVTYAHVVGAQAPGLSATGVEKLEDDFLSGETGSDGQVVLTLRKKVQDAAFNDLKDNAVKAKRGAVIAIAPATGAVLASVSMPAFDPNALVAQPSTAFPKLAQDTSRPLVNRVWSDSYPPASTFTTVVAAAALQAGLGPDSAISGGDSYQIPGTTTTIRNAGGVACPAQTTLKKALSAACNTAFARLGVNLGADRIDASARLFGFNQAVAFDRDDTNALQVATSKVGSLGRTDRSAIAQSCIGLSDVRMTPLQGAMIAAAIANDGAQMRPYIVDSVLKSNQAAIYRATPAKLRQSVPAQVATDLRGILQRVVDDGVGQKAQLDGIRVGGMASTTQDGESWFIGYAVKDDKPVVAIAVLLEDAGVGGGSEASRIGGNVMRAATSTT